MKPRPSSTVILLREEAGAAEPFTVLLVKRHGTIAFPDAHAFPGGVVDPSDARATGVRLPDGERWAPPGEGDHVGDAAPYWIAAVRELFEETGILLGRRGDTLLEGPLPDDVVALRARLLAGEEMAPLLAEVGVEPATERLRYFARWITPVASPRRWDTRFLVAAAPPGQEAVADGTESVACEWRGPRAALAAYEAGEIVLIPPTVRTLDDLAGFASVADVLADAAQRVVRGVTPEVVREGEETAISYPDARDATAAPRRLVLRDGRWRPV